MKLLLDGTPRLEDLVRLARRGGALELGPTAWAAARASHRALSAALAAGERIYGCNTGVGALDDRRLTAAEAGRFQLNLVRSHALAAGPPMADDAVRAMMLIRAAQLAGGASGIAPPTLEGWLALLERGVIPVVPSLGSVGASDLCALAHAALVLVGEGQARSGGAQLPGAEALARAGLSPVELSGRDGLALINSPAATVAVAALAVHDAERLIDAAEDAAAMTRVALGSGVGALDPRAIATKAHPGAAQSARRMRERLAGAAARDWREPLAVRVAHEVTGAVREALASAHAVVERELAAPVDNPVVRHGLVHGNGTSFDTHRLALALDQAASALTALAVTSERRSDRLLSAPDAAVRPFLVHPAAPEPLSTGLMLMQYLAAALVAELRAQLGGSGLGSPTCAGFEDAVSMAPLSARRLAEAVTHTAHVIAIELLCAAQRIDISGLDLPPRIARLHRRLRTLSPVVVEDRSLSDEVATVARALLSDAEPLQCAAAAG